MKHRVQELPIAALITAAAEDMCHDLLSSGPLVKGTEAWRKEVARELARRFAQHPVWLTLAVHVLETHGDLTKVPQTAEGLADCYLEEIVNRQQQAPSDQILALLRWVALIGTVNRKDDPTVRLLGDRSKIGDETAIRKMLASLVQRRALVQRGAGNRLVEVKPDVLRDHLLLSWLSVDVGYGAVQSSEDAKVLVASVLDAVLQGNISAVDRSILIALARTELLLRLSGRPVPLLDPFFAGIRDALELTTAGPRLVIAEVLLDVAEFCAADTVALSRALRLSVIGSETIEGLMGSREVGQDDVTLELAWPVFHAAMGAQTPVERQQVLDELCALTELEAEIATRRPGGLPNNGRRAADLVGRTLGGGPQFWSDFEDAACTLAARLLDRAAMEPATSPLAAVLRALLVPAMALERQQMWSEDYTLHFRTYVVLPDHPAWQTREAILTRVKYLLADVNVPLASRLILWPLLAEAHSSAIRCRGQVPESLQEQMRLQLLDDLVWTRAILTTGTVELEELVAARDLWNWHYRFDKEPTLKAASEELEALYGSNDLAREFEPLLGHDEWEQRDGRAAAKAAELAAGQRPETIWAFIDRAVRFLGGEPEFSQLFSVAWHLGQHASMSEVVRNFVKGALAELAAPIHTDFATVVVSSWVAALRKHDGPTAAYDLIAELLQVCNSDEKRMHVIQQLYGGSLRPREIGELTQAEHDHLRSLAPLFVKNGRGPAFIEVVGWTLHHDWPALRALISRVLDDIPPEQMRLAIKFLVDAVYSAVCERNAGMLPQGLGPWVLDQLVRMPDLGSLGENLGWYIEEVLKQVGHAPLSWLPKALVTRRDMEAQGGSEKVRAMSRHARISRYVAQISATHMNDPEVGQAVEALIDLAWDRGAVGYYMLEVLRDVDPEGILIPAEVKRRLANVTSEDEVWWLARIAGAYAIGSSAWRTIAKPVILRAVRPGSEEERRSLFNALTDHGPRFWRGTPGEVPQTFVSGVESARQMLESETDFEFRPFWEWYLAVAEAELREQEEQAKEMRGE